MARIGFWSADSSGCCWYRCELPAAALRSRGHEVTVSNLLTELPGDCDVVVGQRVCLPGASKGWAALSARGAQALIYELDDDLLNVDPSNGPAWDYFSRPDIRANIKRNIQIADAVTCTTEPLAEKVKLLNTNVHVIPNFIPEELTRRSQFTSRKPAGSEPLTIGWAGGASHAMDWAQADEQVARFIARTDTSEMHVMGWCPPDLWRRLPTGHRRYSPWVDSVPELYRRIDFGVGVIPLRPHVFNQSKSDIKFRELSALGIPSIASDAGPYPSSIRHGETGFLVRRPHEWGTYLRELLDPNNRLEMGSRARAAALSWTIEGNIELWESALLLPVSVPAAPRRLPS